MARGHGLAAPLRGPLLGLGRARPVALASWQIGAFGQLAARLAVPLLAGLLDGPGAAAGVALAQEAGLLVARRFGAGGLYLGAFALRAVLAFGLFAYLERTRGQGTLLQDDYVYDLAAYWLVRIARGEGLSLFPSHVYFLDNAYAYFLAGLYALVGHAGSVPRAANAAFAGLAAVLMADMGRRLFGRRVGRAVGVAAAVLPTLVVWSLTTLKETLVLLAVATALWCLLRLLEAPRRSPVWANAAVGLAAALVLLADLRAGAAWVVAAAVGLALGARAVPAAAVPPALRGWRAALAGGMAIALAGLAVAAVQNDGPIGGLRALGFAVLAPAPWQVRSPGELAAGAEVLLWYVLLAGAAVSWRGRPRVPLFAAAMAFYGGATWVGLATTDGNLGNLLRHRTMLTPPLLVLGLGGLSAAVAAWRSRASPD